MSKGGHEMDLAATFLDVAILAFGVSLAIYYERAVREWPRAQRWMRYVHGLGMEVTCSRYVMLIVLVVTSVVFLAGMLLFVFSLLEFERLAGHASTEGAVNVSVLVPSLLVIFLYLFVPHFLLHLSRGVLQALPKTSKDFLSYYERYKQNPEKLGMSSESARVIAGDIMEHDHLHLLRRVIVSLNVVLLLVEMPFFIGVLLGA